MAVLSPFEKKFWTSFWHDISSSDTWKRAGVEMWKMVIMDVGHWKHEFNGDLEAAYAELDRYTAKQFGMDAVVFLASLAAGYGAGKALGAAARTASGKAFSQFINAAANRARVSFFTAAKGLRASITRFRTGLKLIGTGKLAGTRARNYTAEIVQQMRGMRVNGELSNVDPQLLKSVDDVIGAYGLGTPEELDAATLQLRRMQAGEGERLFYGEEVTSMLDNIILEAEETAAHSRSFLAHKKQLQELGLPEPTFRDFEAAFPERAANIRKYGGSDWITWVQDETIMRVELNGFADESVQLLRTTPANLKSVTNTQKIDNLIEQYANGGDVFDSIIKQIGTRSAIRTETIATRQAELDAVYNGIASTPAYERLFNAAPRSLIQRHKVLIAQMGALFVTPPVARVFIERMMKALPEASPSGTLAPTNEPDGDDEMDLEEDVDNKVTVTRGELMYALGECDKAYADEVPEGYKLIESNGAKAIMRQHEDGTYEITFRSTHIGGSQALKRHAIGKATGTTLRGALSAMGMGTTLSLISSMASGIGAYAILAQKFANELDADEWASLLADLNAHVIALNIAFESEYLPEHGVVGLGFALYLKEIYDLIISEIKDLKFARIICNGHSLGAAVAQLFALKLLLVEGVEVDRVHCFGSPRGFDTVDTVLSDNVNVIHVLDDLDPITFGYPIFFDGQTGFKFIHRKTGEIEYLNNDELTTYTVRDYIESSKYYKMKQSDPQIATPEQRAQYWDKDVQTLTNDFYRKMTSTASSVKQFQYELPRRAIKQMYRVAVTEGHGLSHHWTPYYAEVIRQLPESHTFTRNVWSKAIVTNELGPGPASMSISSLSEWFEKAVIHPPESQPVAIPPPMPSIPRPIQSMTSFTPQTLADYVTADMNVMGFTFYETQNKTNTENNFIQW